VVLLRRAPSRELSFAALFERTGIDRDELRRSLRELAAAGFVKNGESESAALAARPADDDAALDEIVSLHERDKTRLVIAITEISMDRLRNLAGKAFADAFLIRKKSGDDHG
jgi:hypothetical protein